MTRQPLPSLEQQKQALQRKGVNIGRAKTKSAVYSLYHFYVTQKHPKSMPRYLAYRTEKRFETRVETAEQPEKIMVRTGTGQKISARQLLRKLDKSTAREVKHELPPVATMIGTSKRFKSGKRDDGFRYRLDPSLEINFLNYKSKLQRLHSVHIPEITEVIDLLYKWRGRFYGSRIIGAAIFFDTENTPDFTNNPRGVKFTSREEFPEYLFDMLYELIVTDILRHYKDAIITIKYIEVYIRTQQHPSNIEQLL